jgi:hypothetical protein
MSILTQIGDSGTTKALASGAATAAIFAAYQHLVYGLTGESFLQAASTAAVSSMMYRSAFGVPPNMQSLAVVAACDLGGQVVGPYASKIMTFQSV